MNENLARKTKRAFKWSSITELVTRAITPITNMILARILLPEAFGVLASIMMIIAFADVFVESGFQKFLIQHNFKTADEENKYLSVAFWANSGFALVIWLIIYAFRNQLAVLVGNEELGGPIAITSLIIPLYSIVGIQNCRLRKELEFKKLFTVRLAAALVPLFITVPCALLGLDYWALIIGQFAGVIVRMIILYIQDHFRPEFIFDTERLFHMLSFGIWTLLDGLALWASSWIDTLLISRNLSDYNLGLYKNSVSIIQQFVAIITGAITPVLFASLSKLEGNNKEFNSMFLKVQHTLAVFLIPMGAGLWFYRNLAVLILFGDKWKEAGNIVGIMAVTIILRTVLVSFYSDAYRAKGKFQIPFYLQIMDVAMLVPACIIAVSRDFWTLVYTRAFIRLDLIIPEAIFVFFICGITPKDTLKTLLHPVIATGVMSLGIILTRDLFGGIIWEFFTVCVAVVCYFAVLFLFRDEREKYLVPAINKLKSRKML